MKKLVAGILAHVDAGKTTLSEALLYEGGVLRRLGRVDHGDAFLDSDAIERQRGITIFSEPAVLQTRGMELTLIDTPGHVDFAAEMERTLAVLDFAILVVSGADGIQAHTETVWRLLQRNQVPVFVFVNKMDALGADRRAILAQLTRRFGDGFVDFTAGADGNLPPETLEDIATLDETAMEAFLSGGNLGDDIIQDSIAARRLFPVFFGAALKSDGVAAFLDGFARYAAEPRRGEAFGARAYKISHDGQGNRLTWLKVTGGELKAKAPLEGTDPSSGERWQQKADQLRAYSGARFETVASVGAGSVAAVTGLDHSYAGEGFGAEADAGAPLLQPVLTYTLIPGGEDVHRCLAAVRELGDEEPLLHVAWEPTLKEIRLQLMGAVQLEIVQQLLADRFGLHVSFDPGSILYKETVAAPVEGVGHFEPLRHYAEAHILIEPLPAGSGVEVASDVSLDDLDGNWQRLIMAHCREKEHRGVLIGAPLTDVRLTLVAGRGHDKHTEGGDFRQATYRAIRQGLMELRAGAPGDGPYAIAERYEGSESGAFGGNMAQDSPASSADASAGAGSVELGNCVLLEPWYRFRLEVPAEMLGRAMSDVQRMGGEFALPQGSTEAAPATGAAAAQGTAESTATLEGSAPVSRMRDYAMEVNAYTHGTGRIALAFGGYRPALDAAQVVAQAHYDPEADVENTPDSVFCAHGAGYPVKWYKVPEFMHLAYRDAR